MRLELYLLATGPHLVSASYALSNQLFVSLPVQRDVLQESVGPLLCCIERLLLCMGNVIGSTERPATVTSYGRNIAKVHAFIHDGRGISIFDADIDCVSEKNSH